ncbi:MAG: glycosyltransferase, partial [Verrucomicrobia bacterium]|nr:glycosyltransferase [Verrucomicrobiota bacterium]
MRVLLTSHGSIGDIYPIIAYGKALREAGHQVTFASAPLYEQEIQRAGLNYLHLPPEWEQEIFTEFMRELNRANHLILQLRAIYRGALPFLSELIDRVEEALRTHDVLVSSNLFPHYKAIAARQDKPFVSIAFCHNTIPSPDYPPELVPPLRGLPYAIQSAWNMFFWRLANVVVDKSINQIIGEKLAQKGLPQAKNFLMNPSELVLAAVSKALMSNRGKMDPRFRITGFLRWQAKESEELEARICAFCRGEHVPILTFGSVAFDDTHLIMSRFERNWPKGEKIIVQTGWSGLSVEVERPDILVLGKVSHDQLFRHASCVIHHGGAGTTASVLSAGRPQIIIPHIADQHFWGAEIERLGVGEVLKKRRWPERLHTKLQSIEANPSIREK